MGDIPRGLDGCKLFPVLPGDKRPALSYGWQSRATDDPAQLAEWNGQMGSLNWGVACGPSGLFVIDIDKAGLPVWQDMQERSPELREAVARAFTVRTPSGGLHHYFRGQGPTTARAIGEGIDTRGGYVDERTGKMKSIGYVVAPGSVTKAGAGPKTVDGEYKYLGGEILPIPSAVLAIMPDKKKGAAIGLEKPVTPDNPRNIQWVKDLLTDAVARGEVSIEGSGGDDTCFRMVARVLDKGVSPATAFELLDEIWNPHCVPPWEDWELEQKIQNALAYGEETGEGNKGFLENAQAFADFVGKDFGADEIETEKTYRRKLQLIHEYAASAKDPSWLIKDFIPAQGTGLLYGMSGSFKSFIALDMALCLSYGHAGQWGAPPVRHDVIYFAGESPRGMAKVRKPAWQEWQGKSGDESHRFFFFDYVPAYQETDVWNDIKAQIAELDIRPRFIVIDTLTRLMTGMDENSTKEANMITRFLEQLAEHYDCFVLAVHHTGKDEGRGARGSSAFYANLDSALYLKKKGNGVALIVKNHKEADPKDGETYFQKSEYGQSIVLKQVEALEDEVTDRTGSRISWSDPKEILARVTKAGGRLSNALLVQEIMAELHIDRGKVMSELRRRGDIQWLREGDFWRSPEMERTFDL